MPIKCGIRAIPHVSICKKSRFFWGDKLVALPCRKTFPGKVRGTADPSAARDDQGEGGGSRWDRSTARRDWLLESPVSRRILVDTDRGWALGLWYPTSREKRARCGAPGV